MSSSLASSASSSRFARYSLLFADISSRSDFLFSSLSESLAVSSFISSISCNTCSISCCLPSTSLPILPLFDTASSMPLSISLISWVIRFIFSEIKLRLLPSEVISTIRFELSLEMLVSELCSSSSPEFNAVIRSSYDWFLPSLSDSFMLTSPSAFLSSLSLCSVSFASIWIWTSFSSFALKSLNALS